MDERSDLKKIKNELNDQLFQTLTRFLKEKNISRPTLISTIENQTGISIHREHFDKFFSPNKKENHYIDIIVIFLIAESFDLPLSYFFKDTDYEDLFLNNDQNLTIEISDKLSVIYTDLDILDKSYYCYFYSTNSKESNQLVCGELSFKKINDKMKATMLIHSTEEKTYSSDVIYSKKTQYISCIFTNLIYGEMSFISFTPVHLTAAKMNYVIAECLTTCSGASKVPTVHRMVISNHDIINECEDIIRMQLLMNTSKVYISEENIEYLKNQYNITENELLDPHYNSKEEKYLVFKESDLISLLKYQIKKGKKIDIDDLFIKLRTNDFASHYNKVGVNVNKKLFELIKERK